MNIGARAFLAGLSLWLAQPLTAQTLRPEPGLWYNPERSGHGVDFQFAGNSLVGIWYTYDTSGRPTWYIASGPYSGTTWSAPLVSARWNGSAATLTTVGTLGLKLFDDEHADLSWSLPGGNGSEPFERLRFASGIPVANLTGVYHDAAQTGWGLSFEVQGSTAAAVLYFYDSGGLPRWALGTGPVAASGTDKAGANNIPMASFHGGSGPFDAYAGLPIATASGTLSFAPNHLTTNVVLPNNRGNWLRDVLPGGLTDNDPPFLFARIQGPTTIPQGSTVPYSAALDTNLTNLGSLEYQWTLIVGDRVVQSTAAAVNLQPAVGEGLANLQVEVTHPPSGRRAFASLNVSVQVDNLFEAAITPRQPHVRTGRPNYFDAAVLGGRAPFRYQWTGVDPIQDDAAFALLRPRCEEPGASVIELAVSDADNRVAQARYAYTVDSGDCRMTILGPGCIVGPAELVYSANFGGNPAVAIAGHRYQWASTPNILGPRCGEGDPWCKVTGLGGNTGEFYALSVAQSAPGIEPATRMIERNCGANALTAELILDDLTLPLNQPAALEVRVNGGAPPYTLVLACGLEIGNLVQAGSGFYTGSCRFSNPGNYRVLVHAIDNSQSTARDQELVSVNSDMDVSLTTPASPETCRMLDFGIAIANGMPPFQVRLDFGDGNVVTQTTSSRNLTLQHLYAAGPAVARNALLSVEDATGIGDDLLRTLSPANVARDVPLLLANQGNDNIHIYDHNTSSTGWFDISTRLSPGGTRTESIAIAANVCETPIDFGAGRGGAELASARCTISKSQTAPALVFRESGAPSLSCE